MKQALGWIERGVVALLSAAIGWTLGASQHVHPPQAAPQPSLAGAGVLRATQGWSVMSYPQPPGTAAAPSASPSPASVEAACPPRATPQERTQWLNAIREGDESTRIDGLLKTRSAGVPLPDDLLQTLFENDASERVRLLAFENYLEPRSGSVEGMRQALQAALDIPSAAIQADARRRLSQLAELEHNDAAHPQLTQ